uniref:Immunoglobulin V-set domain-containing protein n=1 Tax=Amphiprion percula TaxID=161767 RepID=A0A3P8SCZ9_AMPPE
KVTMSLLRLSSLLSDKVDQTPTDIHEKQGQQTKILCSHRIDRNGQLQFLGYMHLNKGYPEDGVEITLEGDANKDKNCTLTINSLSVSSSAVYFCAASYHSATYH